MPKKGEEIELRGDEKEVRNTAPLWSGSFVYEDVRYQAIQVWDFYDEYNRPTEEIPSESEQILVFIQDVAKLICYAPYR